MAQMDPLWIHDDTVMDKEPLAKTTALGLEPTRKNFEGLFRVPQESRSLGLGPRVQVQGYVTWVMGVVARTATQDGPASEA